MCIQQVMKLFFYLIFSNLSKQQTINVMIPRHFSGALFLCLFIQTSLFSFQNGYTGVWEFTDTDGSAYLVHIAENHTLASTYAKGDHTIVPQEGYWRLSGKELHIIYKNGLMDILRSTKNGYSRTSYESGAIADKKGGKTYTVFKTGRKSI